MKQKLTVALILIAVAIPAAALAAPQTTYTGHLTGSPDSTVKLKESFGDLERAVKVFSVRDLEVECDGRHHGGHRSHQARRLDPGRQGRRLRAPATTTAGRSSRCRGHIGRNKASGTFRYSGKVKDQQRRRAATATAASRAWVARR